LFLPPFIFSLRFANSATLRKRVGSRTAI
jgi:hypothetical protein